MKDINEKLKAKLLKLQALAEQGIGGEATNAKNILEKILKKHNIDINSFLDDTKTKKYFFGYKTEFEKRLLFRIFMKIKSLFVEDDFKYFQRGKKIGFELSEYEFIEFEILKEGYFNAWKKTLKNMETAFVWKHHLAIESNMKSDDKTPLTEEERAELFLIGQMSMGVSEAKFKRNLLKA
ncbi:hypothetical protein [Campylobacter sp. RM16188]|uniref:hypothetical protein n=1 Tax=Campylobacter sp. RM16188 TaxID=1705725 RepID=UPI001556C965|nr:hypothetical protein [Campylobacter sp. RM16188]